MTADKALCNERLEGETFEQYKERRRNVNSALRIYLRGTLVWKSKEYGSYKKPKSK